MWIDPVYRVIAHVCIQIDIPTPKPNRILTDKPLQPRVIIPCPVVIEARAVVLAPSVLGRIGRGCTTECRLAEWFIGVLSLHRACCISERQRGAEAVGQETARAGGLGTL